MKKIRLILLLIIVSFMFTSVPTFAMNLATLNDGIGRIKISTMPLPSYIVREKGTYTYSGKVLVSYNTANDINTTDFMNLAVMNDDGKDFKTIFSGIIPTKSKANGIRFMPFKDNKRILLGDYVLECSPNIDNCTSTELVPVVFPDAITSDAKTMNRWTEVIIAPDNVHMAWTMLRSDYTSAALLGSLIRQGDNYVIENPQVISTVSNFKNDQNNPGYIIPNVMIGGEVKQFVHGGNAISVVGQKLLNTTDSVVQDLTSKNITQITYTPGYDETTIFSPDEHLGITMTSRFSEKTDPAIFGLMPRPYATYTCAGLNTYLYKYAVTGVRSFREGNVGPALIDINRSMFQPDYKGINLNTDANWVFSSPMSWHPDGKRAMWVETLRGTNTQRLQKVELLDYSPQKTVQAVTTTDNVPYGIKDLSVISSLTKKAQGKIAGKKYGYINYTSNASSLSGSTESQYVNYSDDGINFYNGYEKFNYNFIKESRYEANIKLTIGKGNTTTTGSAITMDNSLVLGDMNFRATFSSLQGATPAKLLFDIDTDGKPKSYGYVKFNGKTLNINDLIQ